MRFEPRGKVSTFWTYASPALAIGLTIFGSGVVFWALGQEPGPAVYTSSSRRWSRLAASPRSRSRRRR